MISVIITAFKEPQTIKKSISSFFPQMSRDTELLVVAPDDETLHAAREFQKGERRVKLIKDLGKGKSAALNLAVSKARGDILVLSDGDVYVSEHSLSSLLEQFKDKVVGAVSGNPVSLNSRKNKYGFWSYLLTQVADKRRKEAKRLGKRFFCSGYFFAIRRELFPSLPEELLSEDGFISHCVYEKGFKIEYADHARVFVKYPDNFEDWIKQKRRSAGGYNQLKKMINVEIRSFRKELIGTFNVFEYPSNLREIRWLFTLLLARLYLWGVIYKDVNIRKKKREELWERVESTK